MNPMQRTELLRALADLSQRYPDWRFGQLVANVAGWIDADVWDVEDGQLLSMIRDHLGGAATTLERVQKGLNL